MKAAAAAHKKQVPTTTRAVARGEADVLVHGIDLLVVHSFFSDALKSADDLEGLLTWPWTTTSEEGQVGSAWLGHNHTAVGDIDGENNPMEH
ncbi:hypothetical protein ACFVKB_17075 [Rhodococcus sp. NPDC127530]|uniref:hypothetical protein n=1 Tax=unclassified Rhodococcus (in: high G+C Gram-positive bacteria) TaxID=192944 RepID=UPI003639A6CC